MQGLMKDYPRTLTQVPKWIATYFPPHCESPPTRGTTPTTGKLVAPRRRGVPGRDPPEERSQDFQRGAPRSFRGPDVPDSIGIGDPHGGWHRGTHQAG